MESGEAHAPSLSSCIDNKTSRPHSVRHCRPELAGNRSVGEARMLGRSVVWMAIAVVLLGGTAHAQTVAIAQISGVVSDESGLALPGVEVQVTQVATGASRFVVTDERGEYLLANLPIGPYKLEAKLQGFSTYERTGLTLTVGATAVINVVLKIGTLQETVTVLANSPLVETRNT